MNFAAIPLDWIIIAIVLLLVTLDAYRGGASRAIAASLALPIAVLLYGLLLQSPLMSSMFKSLSPTVGRALLFALIAVLLFILIHRMISSYGGDRGRVLQALMCGIAFSVVLIVSWLQVAALLAVWHPGAMVSALFGASYWVFWLIGAFILLVLARR
ncbi:MAG: hypothetical protein JO019_01730 [Candidatus Kaiserbacteria bacterium]|nr:hypothetical protein [Candidatus Kaiserbacteria bacterium]